MPPHTYAVLAPFAPKAVPSVLPCRPPIPVVRGGLLVPAPAGGGGRGPRSPQTVRTRLRVAHSVEQGDGLLSEAEFLFYGRISYVIKILVASAGLCAWKGLGKAWFRIPVGYPAGICFASSIALAQEHHLGFFG